MTDTIERVLKIDALALSVSTNGNFSTVSKTWPQSQKNYKLGLGFLRMVLYEFEEQFNLRIISWQTEEYPATRMVQILINHEPKLHTPSGMLGGPG